MVVIACPSKSLFCKAVNLRAVRAVAIAPQVDGAKSRRQCSRDQYPSRLEIRAAFKAYAGRNRKCLWFSDFDDHIIWLLDFRVRNIFHGDVAGSVANLLS